MKSRKTKTLLSFPLLLIITSLPFASANAALFYQPVPANIPTLSGTMLILLSLLLMAVSFRLVKKNPGAKHFVISILGIAALLSASGGIKIVSDAFAAAQHEMVAAGGQLPINSFELNTYNNNSGVTQKITDIVLPTSVSEASSSSSAEAAVSIACPDHANANRCQKDAIMPHGSSCVIDCSFGYDGGEGI